MSEFVVEVVVGANQTETQPNQCADEQRVEDAVATEIPAKQEELALVQPTPPEEPAPKREDPTPPEDPKPKEATTDDAKGGGSEEAAGGNAIAAAAEGHEQPADGATEQKLAAGEQLEAMEQEQDEEGGEVKEHASDPGVAGILPPSGPYWLSSEEVLAKGIAENEVENYRKYFLQFSHLPHAWYERLKDHTFETETIKLSSEEVSVLIKASRVNGAEPQLSEDDRRVIGNVEDRLGTAIAKFGDSGANLRVGNRSPSDSLYLNEDQAFVAKVQEAIVGELEAEPLHENAYSGWREKSAQHKSGFKRGIDTIRKSLRRSRTPKKVLVVEEDTKPVASSTELQAGQPAGGDTTQQPSTTEMAAAAPPQPSADESNQPSQSQPVQAEVHMEEPAAAAIEQKVVEPADATKVSAVIEHLEGPSFGLSLYSANENLQSTPVASKSASNENMASGDSTEGKKEGKESENQQSDVEVKPKPEVEPEIQRVSEEEHRPAGEGEVVTSKPQPEEHHHKKVKAETPANQVLRAFMRVMTSMLRVTSGKEALDKILASPAFQEELSLCQQVHQGADVYVLRYEPHLAQYPDFRFRGFVHKNELCALCQLNITSYSPLVAVYKENIREMVSELFNAHLKEPLSNYESYALDFHVLPSKVLVGKIYPLHSGIDAFMFSWRKDLTVLTGSSTMVFRILKSSKSNPYAGLTAHWQGVLQAVEQQRTTNKKSGKCVLL
ncbi:hypothetical protein EMCRGX_G016849 [Ephydatia muelleri]